MSHASAFATPWYVAGLRRLAATVNSVADSLDRAFQPAPPDSAVPPQTEYEIVLARAAEESLANTRHRLSRYY